MSKRPCSRKGCGCSDFRQPRGAGKSGCISCDHPKDAHVVGASPKKKNPLAERDGLIKKTTKDGRPVVNGIELVRVVGQGSFGKVFLGRRLATGEAVAVKVLQKECVVEQGQVTHTMDEQRIMRSLNHPFLVRLLESFQTSTTLYLVLDYVNGGELFYYLDRERTFTEERARFYAAELVLALGYLHSQHVVYRDLKPENVLLDRFGHVRLTDFGLSRDSMTDDKLTSTVCGTAEYCAPEMIQGQAYGKAVDWWSLGSLIYEMVVGDPPFESAEEEDKEETFARILNEPVLYPDTFSEELQSLLSGMLEKDPSKRLTYAEIIAQPFFDSIDWDLLLEKKVQPPFWPDVKSSDEANFLDASVANLPCTEDKPPNRIKVDQKLFKGFSFSSEKYSEPDEVSVGLRRETRHLSQSGGPFDLTSGQPKETSSRLASTWGPLDAQKLVALDVQRDAQRDAQRHASPLSADKRQPSSENIQLDLSTGSKKSTPRLPRPPITVDRPQGSDESPFARSGSWRDREPAPMVKTPVLSVGRTSVSGRSTPRSALEASRRESVSQARSPGRPSWGSRRFSTDSSAPIDMTPTQSFESIIHDQATTNTSLLRMASELCSVVAYVHGRGEYVGSLSSGSLRADAHGRVKIGSLPLPQLVTRLARERSKVTRKPTSQAPSQASDLHSLGGVIVELVLREDFVDSRDQIDRAIAAAPDLSVVLRGLLLNAPATRMRAAVAHRLIRDALTQVPPEQDMSLLVWRLKTGSDKAQETALRAILAQGFRDSTADTVVQAGAVPTLTLLASDDTSPACQLLSVDVLALCTTTHVGARAAADAGAAEVLLDLMATIAGASVADAATRALAAMREAGEEARARVDAAVDRAEEAVRERVGQALDL